MSKGKINFKGINGGLYIEVVGGDFELILSDLDKKLRTNKKFYKNAEIKGINSDELELRQKLELAFLLKHKYRLKVTDEYLDKIAEGFLVEEEPEEEPEALDDGVMTKFFNKTIRSGQEIEYDGNVVVVGDVNSGAIIRATGSIVVLGNFRGVAHAGFQGDKEAIVASYKLMPIQLRIADKIARSPDDGNKSNKMPEMAKIVEDRLIIEPYLPNK